MTSSAAFFDGPSGSVLDGGLPTLRVCTETLQDSSGQTLLEKLVRLSRCSRNFLWIPNSHVIKYLMLNSCRYKWSKQLLYRILWDWMYCMVHRKLLCPVRNGPHNVRKDRDLSRQILRRYPNKLFKTKLKYKINKKMFYLLQLKLKYRFIKIEIKSTKWWIYIIQRDMFQKWPK